MRRCHVYWLGRVEYGEALGLQRRLAAARIGGDIGDHLLLLEHSPVITLGRGAKREHLLCNERVFKERGIELYEIERGGDVTYHGPGQLVGYPILDLSQHGKDLRLYMRNLEEVLLRTLQNYGIQGERNTGKTGVWVQGSKIASIGVHVSRWVSWHGFALNVNTDLRSFDLIVPCGIPGIRMTSLAKLLGRKLPLDGVANVVVRHFAEVFDVTAEYIPQDRLEANGSCRLAAQPSSET